MLPHINYKLGHLFIINNNCSCLVYGELIITNIVCETLDAFKIVSVNITLKSHKARHINMVF